MKVGHFIEQNVLDLTRKAYNEGGAKMDYNNKTSAMKNLILMCMCIFVCTQCTNPVEVIPLDGRGGGIIAFYSERDGNSAEIYIMNADGSAETRLTHNKCQDLTPDLSPDGSHLVFISNRDGRVDIYQMNTNGSGVIRLTNTVAEDAYPFYSYDGSKIVYSSKQGGNWEIYLMDADGSNQTRITNTPENEEWPHLSHDLSKIVYGTGAFPNFDIYLMNSDGSNPTPFVTLPGGQALPKWSPDGNTIAHNYGFFEGDFSNWSGDIYLINSDGTSHRKITGTSQKCINESPYWSKDGNKLVFQSNRTGNFQIYTMDADGSNQVRLTNHQGNDYWPCWSVPAKH